MTGVAPGVRSRGRRLVAALLLSLALVVGTFGGAAACFRHSVVDSRRFGERVTAALVGPQAREVIGRQVAEQIVARAPPALLVRPVIEGAVQTVLTLPAFRGILTAAVADLHAAVLRGDSTTVTLRLVDVVLLVKVQLAATVPRAAALIPDDLTMALVRLFDRRPDPARRSMVRPDRRSGRRRARPRPGPARRLCDGRPRRPLKPSLPAAPPWPAWVRCYSSGCRWHGWWCLATSRRGMPAPSRSRCGRR